jgi:hypothetical protein
VLAEKACRGAAVSRNSLTCGVTGRAAFGESSTAETADRTPPMADPPGWLDALPLLATVAEFADRGVNNRLKDETTAPDSRNVRDR